MGGFSKVKTAGRQNRPSIQRGNDHVLRRLLSNLDAQEDGGREAEMVPMHQASAEDDRANQKFLLNLASPDEQDATASLPVVIPALQAASQSQIAPQSTVLPTSTVTNLPHLTTPTATPITTIKTTMNAPSVSSTTSSQSLCSGGASCVTPTSNYHPTITSKPVHESQQSVASSGPNSGLIFIGFLAGIAILAITIATVSYAVKRWCNKRQRGRMDDDTWRFLETPKNFEYPFFGFQNKPSERTMGISDEKCVSSFIENKGGSWVVPEVPAKSYQSVFLGTYHPFTQEHSGAYFGESTLPEVVYPESSLQTANFYHNATMPSLRTQLPATPTRTLNINRPASAFI